MLPPLLLTVDIAGVFVEYIFVYFLCIAESAEDLVKSAHVVLDGNGDGAVILWVLIHFRVAPYDGLA